MYHIVSDTVIQFQGLTVVQVSQNQAAVVSDPQVLSLLNILLKIDSDHGHTT